MSKVTCKSYEFTELYNRRHDGYSLTFFGYPTPSSGTFNAGLEVSGPKTKAPLVRKLLAAVAAAWPDKDLQFEVDDNGKITDVF